MTVDDLEIRKLSEVYEQIFEVFANSELTPEMAFGVVVKLLVYVSGDMPKTEMLGIISAAHDLDRFLRPTSQEVH
jgi:hypothetical protein